MNYGKIDKNKFMTLENTVDLLIDAVNQHYDVDRVLANFGIKVLGTKSSPDELPTPAVAFGDAYLVSTAEDGQGEPYDVYIWTRYDSNETDPQYGFWLNIGLISTVGPQGPEGKPGIQGPTGESTRWYVGNTVPLGNYNIGDMLLLTNGSVYIYGEGGWGNPALNIKGTPGKDGINGYTPYIEDNYWYINGMNTGVRATGPAGANGTPGTAIIIVGKRDSVDDLPDADTVPRNYGYLVNVNGVEQLYFIAGVEGEEHWEHIDYSGNGTIVTTDGTALSSWDTNTKVDKTNSVYKIYATSNTGEQITLTWGYGASVNQVPVRIAGGNIGVPETPGSDNSATSKKYVDDVAATKISKVNLSQRLYSTNDQGVNNTTSYAAAPTAYTMLYRYTDGRAQVGTPVINEDATTKKYVDDLAATKLDVKVPSKASVYGTNTIGDQVMWTIDSAPVGNTIGLRTSVGNIQVGTPVNDSEATPKRYVDSKIKVATFLSAQGQLLNITPADLPGITSNTSIEVTASFSDTTSLPSVTISLDSTSLTEGNYSNIDKVNPYTPATSFKLIYLNNQFIAPKKEPNSDQDDAAYGTTLHIGKVDTTSGQTRVTVVYR